MPLRYVHKMFTYISKGVGLITIFNSTLARDLCRVGGGGETFVQIAQLKLLPVRIGVGLLIWNLPIRLFTVF
jgi:hypothetical protein